MATHALKPTLERIKDELTTISIAVSAIAIHQTAGALPDQIKAAEKAVALLSERLQELES